MCFEVVLIKMASDFDSASILLKNQNEWMLSGLPLFDSTLRVLIEATSNFRNLKKIVVSDSSFVSELFVRSAKSDEKSEAFLCFEKVLKKIKFNFDFIENLNQRHFFTYFFRGVDEIAENEDDKVVLSCLRSFQSFIEIGMCDEYRDFVKKLKKFADSRKRKIANEAQCCIDLMNLSKRKKETRFSSS